ncbi:metallophosphoesterase family protein [Actinomyces respiraculi]|uniref:metallophosphoesterase family protein n=1 Tax=Actinomyces respiraculi TaxID=2744574 RepID=UPI001F20186B|nr:serine/threonine protein phosphatase [Actinomyces respiraculi]
MTDEVVTARPGSALARWWDARTVTFRRVTRTLVLLLLTAAASLGLGVVTATASSPVGPHEAHWSTTLDSRVTLDLGVLGMVSMDSPAGVLGVAVVLGEIPSDGAVSDGGEDIVGALLSTDGAAYLSLITHPEITIEAGLRALAADALRRAGLVASLLLCLVAAGRLATGGRLREAVRARLSHGLPSALLATTVTVMVLAFIVPTLRSGTHAGSRLEVLADTPLAEARLSGRVADVVAAYGGRITDLVDANTAFYDEANANLEAAWQASQMVGGAVDVTASGAAVDVEDMRARAAAATARQTGGALVSPPPVAEGEGPVPEENTTPPGTPTSAEPAPTPSATSAARTGVFAVAERGRLTAVLSTDLHCNLDMIALTGRLDALSGARLHMDDGDLTMTGSAPEQFCVNALSDAVPDGVARVFTVGNHDSAQTAEQMRARGWTVTDGSVQEVAGLRVIGDVDALRTPAGGTFQRGDETSEQIGARLAAATCAEGADVDVVLIHLPYTFGPLISSGCAPLLLAGHVHQEKGMGVTQGEHATVAHLTSGAALGGTSIGPVTEDAYLHVLSFDDEGSLVAWRAVVVHPDASVTVGAWRSVPPVGTVLDGASQSVLDAAAASGG